MRPASARGSLTGEPVGTAGSAPRRLISDLAAVPDISKNWIMVFFAVLLIFRAKNKAGRKNKMAETKAETASFTTVPVRASNSKQTSRTVFLKDLDNERLTHFSYSICKYRSFSK